MQCLKEAEVISELGSPKALASIIIPFPCSKDFCLISPNWQAPSWGCAATSAWPRKLLLGGWVRFMKVSQMIAVCSDSCYIWNTCHTLNTTTWDGEIAKKSLGWKAGPRHACCQGEVRVKHLFNRTVQHWFSMIWMISQIILALHFVTWTV